MASSRSRAARSPGPAYVPARPHKIPRTVADAPASLERLFTGDKHASAAFDVYTTERQIRSFLAENFPLGRNAFELAGDAALLDAGVIDSTGVLEVVDFLESQYAITISDDELVPENLDSIDNIVRFVRAKRGD